MIKDQVGKKEYSFDLLLIITGGIAAYKTSDLVRELYRNNISFEIVLTESAKKFVSPLTLSALTNKQIFSDLFSDTGMDHINLSRLTKLIVICPATANFIAKVSHGFSDDLASSIILASNKPSVFFPAMNPQMYSNEITQQNINKLTKLGMTIIDPEVGEVACLEYGKGKLADISKILKIIRQELKKLD